MRRRLLGVVFVVAMVAMVGLAIGKYAGAFDGGVPVTLQVERVGSQLTTKADVKVRGLKVGTVTDVDATATGATVQMQIDSDKVRLIPAGVSARLLPKTLFGEKYVSLVPPDGTIGGGVRPLAAGSVIPQDRSSTAREVERVLDGLLPLLQEVPPQDLAMTLGSLSQALTDRGETLGQTLVRLQKLTGGLRPAIPDLQADITQLADFADNVDQAAPDLLSALDNLTVTSRTIVDQREALQDLFGSITGASDDLRGFLAANSDNLIGLAGSVRPTLETLARYAPEFPCFFNTIASLIPLGDAAFGKGTGKPGIHVTIEIVNNRGKYKPNKDEPRYLDDRGPRCYPVYDLAPQYPPDGPLKDGASVPAPAVGQPRSSAEQAGLIPASYTGMGLPNSPAERQILAELVSAQTGDAPEAVPTWSSLLLGPLYRGAEVTLA